MVFLYALVCPYLNPSEINLLEAIEHFLVGSAFSTDAEICEYPPPFKQITSTSRYCIF